MTGGRYHIPMELAPYGKDRKRLEDVRADLDNRLAPACDEDIHDRIHAFLMGFSMLRSADGAVAKLLIDGFVEALEGMPLRVVHQACKSWNQRKFTWPNYAFPPTPPLMRQACDEIRDTWVIRARDIGVLLEAKPTATALPAPNARPLTDEEREGIIAMALGRGRIGERRPLNEVALDEAREEQRARAAAALSDVAAAASVELQAIAAQRRGDSSTGTDAR